MRPKPLPPVNVLREWLLYDPETGEIVWAKDRPYCKNKGKKATSFTGGRQYLQVKFEGKSYLAHRIAYALYHGVDPYPYDVDHKERDKLDLRITNLRMATSAENNYNVLRKDNTSGYSGVTWKERLQKWEAFISVEGKKIYLGVFDTLEEAIEARLDEEDRLNLYIHR
jgi:hypothetical protein